MSAALHPSERALRVLRRTARAVHARCGSAGLAGAALLTAAIAALVYAPRMQRDVQVLHEQVDRTRAQLLQRGRDLARQPDSAQQFARFRAWFPSADRATADLRTLFAAAAKHGVQLPRGEYAVVRDEAVVGLARLEVVLPVKERYGAIKAFVGEALNALPHASVSELRIERDGGGTGAAPLEARVKLTLFYRET
ncbi:MAG: hypothetical protein OHK0044_28970 [Burkholderiaceae bacterium]